MVRLRVAERDICTGLMPFLTPSQQCQNIEGNSLIQQIAIIYDS